MEPENVTSETQSAETTEVDFSSEMAAELEKLTKKPSDEESVETAEDESQEASEEEEEDSEESSEEESKEPEAVQKKPSRYERIRARAQAQVEEANRRVEEFARERDDAVKYANLFKLRAEANERRLQAFLESAQQAGLQYSPLEQENYQLRMMQQEQVLEQQYQQNIERQRVEEQVRQHQAAMSNDFATQALDLSAKFTGREDRAFAKKLLVSFAAAAKADPEVTLEQTAHLISNLSRGKAEKNQIDANRSAPVVRTKQARGLAPKFNSIREEMEYSLSQMMKGT